MAEANLVLCAKYPFTSEAKNFVSEKKPPISFELVEEGKKRVLSALVKGEIPKPASILNPEQMIYSYALARMIISQFNQFRINRYAIAEAKRASALLESEDKQVALHVLAGLGITAASASENFWRIPVFEYLRHAPRTPDYKLASQNVSSGFVHSLAWKRVCRVAEEAVKRQVQGSLPLKLQKEAWPKEVLEAGREIDRLLPREEQRVELKIPSESFPPCIKKLLQDLRMHENLSHASRWFLASYLLKAGVKPEEVMGLFKDAPDYNAETTRYQVEYLAKRGYSVPNCDSVDSYGACVAECGTKNPLQFRPEVHGRKLEFEKRRREELEKRERENEKGEFEKGDLA